MITFTNSKKINLITVVFISAILNIEHVCIDIKIHIDMKKSEIITPGGIIIHNSNKKIVEIFSKLINEFSIIWTDSDFVKLPEKNWMKVFFEIRLGKKITWKIEMYFLPLKMKDRRQDF